MTDCIKVEQWAGCVTRASGTTENIIIVREFGVGSSGQAVLARTHYTNVAGAHVTLATGDTVKIGACLECCEQGGGDVTITNTINGNRIATITSSTGQSIDIDETITTFTTLFNSTTGTKIGEYTNEAGTVVEVFAPKGSQYKTSSTTCAAIVMPGTVTLTVEPGLAYTPLQDILLYADADNYMEGEVVSYNTATGVLVVDSKQKKGSGTFCNWTVNIGTVAAATSSVFFGTTTPIAAGQAALEGDFWYTTANGSGTISATNPVLESWVYDATYGWVRIDSPLNVLTTVQPTPTATGNTTNLNTTFKDANGDTWIVDSNGDAIKAGTATPTTTSITPVVYDGSAYVSAQANLDTNLADLVTLSDGTRIHDGEVNWPGHGYEVGKWYYLSQTAVGAVISTQPTSGWVQQLFFVEDANTIHVDIEEGWNYTNSANAKAGVFATFQANQSIANGVVTNLTNLTTVSNTAGTNWNAAAGTFTAPRSGWYDVSANMFYNAGNWNAGAQEQLIFTVNGTYRVSNYIMVETALTNFYPDSIQTHAKIYLNAGDVLRPQAYQGSGSAKTVGNALYNTFSIVEIG